MGTDAFSDPGMDTPIAELPPPQEEPAARPPRRGPRVLRSAIGAGLRYARRAWRPLLAVVLVQLLLGLTVAVPLGARLGARLDRHAHAPALAGSPDAYDAERGWEAGLDAGIWGDVRRLEAGLLEGLATALVALIVLGWLFGSVAAGGFLGTAASHDERVSVGRFFTEGARNFFRMLRVGLLVLAVLYVAGRIVFETWAGVASEAATSQGDAWWSTRLQETVFLVVFLWLRVVADLARADLVVFARRSAVLAFLRALWRTLRHPVRTLGLALAVGVPAFLLLVLFSPIVHAFTGGTWPALVATFLLFQLAVLVRWASRAALLAGDAYLVADMASTR
jgi:hypothetical protein